MDEETARKVLHLIDESIEKWKDTVYQKPNRIITCPLCLFFEPELDISDIPECSVLTDKGLILCPIFKYTGYPQCEETSFYDTSDCFPKSSYKFSPEAKIANNLMLSFLYELRLWYINQLNTQDYNNILKPF